MEVLANVVIIKTIDILQKRRVYSKLSKFLLVFFITNSIGLICSDFAFSIEDVNPSLPDPEANKENIPPPTPTRPTRPTTPPDLPPPGPPSPRWRPVQSGTYIGGGVRW